MRGSTVDTVADATASEAALLLYLGVLATLLGYIFWNVGLKGLGPTRAVTYAYAIPPLAVTFGAIFLDEPVTIWLAARRSARRRRHRARPRACRSRAPLG